SYENDKKGIHRYDAIGNIYNIDFSLRDIHGFRTTELDAISIKDYKHCYFDKIIPVGSWPFIRFYYWCRITDGNKPAWYAKFELAKTDDDKNMSLVNNTGDKQSIIDMLYTIKAQILDKNCKLSIQLEGSGETSISNAQKSDLDKLINAALDRAGEKNGLPLLS